MSYEFSLNQGIMQHSNIFDGVHHADAGRNSILVGPIEVSGTLNVEGDLSVLNEINITGTLDISGNGSINAV